LLSLYDSPNESAFGIGPKTRCRPALQVVKRQGC
jgi:hypothetical protein